MLIDATTENAMNKDAAQKPREKTELTDEDLEGMPENNKKTFIQRVAKAVRWWFKPIFGNY
jgi:hypothetical protein